MITQFFLKDTFTESDDVKIESCANAYFLKPLAKTVELGNDVFNDLEVFHPYDNERYDSTLLYIFNGTHTLGGSQFIEDLLKSPQYNKDILNNRKKCMASLQGIHEEHRSEFRTLEQDFLWIFSEKEDTITDLLNGIYFNNILLKHINQSELFLTSYNIYKICISPTIGILSPILYFIIPFLVLKLKLGSDFPLSFSTYIKLLWKSIYHSSSICNILGGNGKMVNRIQSFTYILSFCFYFQGIINSTQIAMTTHKIVKYICNKMNNAIMFLKRSLECIHQNEECINAYQTSFIQEPFSTIDSGLISFLSTYKPYETFSIFSHFGKQLKFYKTMDTNKFLPLVNRLYFIDALSTINRVRTSHSLCVPNYLEYDDTPKLTVKNSWNIHIDETNAIKNDFVCKNTIVTGPNAGGKSTFIKMMCTNVLLSQTLCVSASSSIDLTPFYMISSQINIPDCKGHESLFEAEMNRCLYNLRAIERFEGLPCFVVMDEIFNSTNVIEAISGAYAILENLAMNTNTLCMITTHLNYLTNLRKTSTFECYCMSVTIQDDTKSISYPYTIKKGISKQYIALELLREKGFDCSIIEKALKIKSKFV